MFSPKIRNKAIQVDTTGRSCKFSKIKKITDVGKTAERRVVHIGDKKVKSSLQLRLFSM